jgi:large subunit ribosomal protein L23
MVDPTATKTLVKEEVQKRYNVKVIAMNMSVHKGKPKNFRGRVSRRSVSKKAFVTLKKGDKIEIV